MPKYDVLSGTRYIVYARNEDEATEKLTAYWTGLDCPCLTLEKEGEGSGRWLRCQCVEEQEVDTTIQIVHVDGHPDA